MHNRVEGALGRDDGEDGDGEGKGEEEKGRGKRGGGGEEASVYWNTQS